MRFSIITVCLNAGDDLIQTVKSTLEQTFSDFEIIVKDGFSTDGSIEKLPVDGRIHIVQKKDKGIYDAMNQGIAASKGDYLLFMNAGDRFFDSLVLANIIKEISVKQSKIYYGKSYNTSLDMYDVCPPKIDKYFCFRSMICHQATVYEANDMRRRGYDTHYKICADRERLMYAVIKEKVEPCFIPVDIALFQGNGVSASVKGRERTKKENAHLLRKYYTKDEIIRYRAKYLLTFPHVRKLMTKNIYTYRLYKKIVGKLYHT